MSTIERLRTIQLTLLLILMESPFFQYNSFSRITLIIYFQIIKYNERASGKELIIKILLKQKLEI